MSVNRPLKSHRKHHPCPDCGETEGLFVDDDNQLTCQLCSWKATKHINDMSNYAISEEDETPERTILRQLVEEEERQMSSQSINKQHPPHA